ncbi:MULTISPECIES: hypothetical protein [Tenacibaculum]|uniref:Late embryogenesis abundant protein LEA-2 subgroup domain-containing protein n=2 Tax=Tenacibaculum TaxID=104267 RepID=A0ABW3JPI0_9FLAO
MAKKTLLLIGTGIAFFSLSAFVTKKRAAIEHVLNHLDFQVISLKNLQFSLKQFSMDLGIRIINPTVEDVHINTGFIKAKVIRVFEKKTGKLLAFSNLDTSVIKLPSGGYYDLPTIHIEIPSLTGAQYLLNELSGKDKQDLLDKFSFELDVKALGATQTIKF